MQFFEKQLQAVKEGDESAFASLFDEYHPRLYNFCLKYLYNQTEAEDIVQETFISIWETRSKIDPTKPFSTYLIAIAKNKIYNLIKRKYVAEKHQEGLTEFMVQGMSEDDRALWNDLIALMFLSMEHLPERQREILMLRTKGLSNPEIAKHLNISLRTVENHYSRALISLRSVMKQEHVYFLPLLFLFV